MILLRIATPHDLRIPTKNVVLPLERDGHMGTDRSAAAIVPLNHLILPMQRDRWPLIPPFSSTESLLDEAFVEWHPIRDLTGSQSSRCQVQKMWIFRCHIMSVSTSRPGLQPDTLQVRPGRDAAPTNDGGDIKNPWRHGFPRSNCPEHEWKSLKSYGSRRGILEFHQFLVVHIFFLSHGMSHCISYVYPKILGSPQKMIQKVVQKFNSYGFTQKLCICGVLPWTKQLPICFASLGTDPPHRSPKRHHRRRSCRDSPWIIKSL